MNKEIQHLTCIVCPVGCQLTVELEHGKVLSVTGNLCKRGVEYASSECVNPVRTLTTTVWVADGLPLSVRSERPLPKKELFNAMKAINEVTLPLGKTIHVGDIVLENVVGTGIDIIATAERKSI